MPTTVAAKTKTSMRCTQKLTTPTPVLLGAISAAVDRPITIMAILRLKKATGPRGLKGGFLEMEAPEPEIVAVEADHDGHGQVHESSDAVEVEEHGLAVLCIVFPSAVEEVGALEPNREQGDEHKASKRELVRQSYRVAWVGEFHLPPM